MKSLEGIRVIEACSNLAGPLTGTIFGDLGAEVIKIEKPSGDDARAFAPPYIGTLGASFQAINRNKKSVVLNFKDPQDLAALHALVKDADIFIHNMRPGVVETLGLSGEEALKLNPRLIYGAISSYGSTGPWRTRPGYDGMAQALGSMVAGNGDPESAPTVAAGGVVDKGSGMWLAMAVLAALFRREKTGKGGIVETSLLETALFFRDTSFAQYQASGKVPPRTGNRAPTIVPADRYETADGSILVMCAGDGLFARLAQALARPDWLKDARFATNSARVINRAELEPQLVEAFAARTRDEWIDYLSSVDVPCAPILDVDEALLHPQVEALGIFRPLLGSHVRLLTAPWKIDGERPPIEQSAPQLGQHTAEVLAGLGRT